MNISSWKPQETLTPTEGVHTADCTKLRAFRYLLSDGFSGKGIVPTQMIARDFNLNGKTYDKVGDLPPLQQCL